MTDANVAMWLVAMAVVEATAILAVFGMAFNGKVLKLHKIERVALIVLAFGLCVQLVRSTHYLQFGGYPIDHIFPLWITKDIGISLLVFFYAFIKDI